MTQPKIKKSESDDESEEDVKPQKKAKKEAVSDEDEDEAVPAPAAKSKTAPRAAAGQAGDELIDEDGRPYFLVSDKKRVTLSEFKGKQYVNIREVRNVAARMIGVHHA